MPDAEHQIHLYEMGWNMLVIWEYEMKELGAVRSTDQGVSGRSTFVVTKQIRVEPTVQNSAGADAESGNTIAFQATYNQYVRAVEQLLLGAKVARQTFIRLLLTLSSVRSWHQSLCSGIRPVQTTLCGSRYWRLRGAS